MLRLTSVATALAISLSLLSCNGGSSPSPSTPTPPPVSVQPPPPPPPPTSFTAGTHRVGEDIESGRFFADPVEGCYWERLSGFSGTMSDVIANDFVGYDAMQYIVQIKPSDAGFKTDEQCDRWYKENPRHGKQTEIRPGIWLIGRQVDAGTWETQSSGGCYWERLRGFGGEIGPDVIANDFVSNPGRVIVTIRGGDLGFNTDGDCGTWQRSSAQTAMGQRILQTDAEKQANRDANRR